MHKETNAIPYSIGFIGGSINSAVGYAHYVSCTMDNKFNIVAGCFSDNEERNHETAKIFGVNSDRVYSNWKQMLKNEQGQLDAIVVLLPTPMHFNVVRYCLEAGYAVICEKALALTSNEIKTIIETQKKHNGFLSVIYNYSGYPMVRELRNKIQKGELGKILHFQIEMPQEGYLKTDANGQNIKPQAWRLKENLIPTIYLDLAVHMHQLIYFLINEKPEKVIADQESFGFFPDVIDNVNCLCRYSKGIQGNIWFSKSAIGHRNGLRLRIFGSKASAEWYQANPEELLFSYSNGCRETIDRASIIEIANLKRYNRFKAGHPAGYIEGFANLYCNIANCLNQYKDKGQWISDTVFGAELSLEGILLFEAMVKSIESKKWESIN